MNLENVPRPTAYVLVERLMSQRMDSGGHRFTPGGGDWRWRLASREDSSIGRTLAEAMEDSFMASKADVFVYRIENGAHCVTQEILRSEVEQMVQRRDLFKATARFIELQIQAMGTPPRKPEARPE